MSNSKPVSDLRNYMDVLKAVSAGLPAFLTKNGRGKYAMFGVQEYKQTEAKPPC